MGVAQAGEELVQGVEGHPHAVEREGRGVHAPLAQGGEGGLVNRQHVAVGVGGLAGGELGDDVIDARAYPVLPDDCVQVAEGGEVMAERVAGDVARFPAAVAPGEGREAGPGAKRREQAVGLDGGEVAGMEILPLPQRSVEEPDGRAREGLGRARGATKRCGIDDESPGHEARHPSSPAPLAKGRSC